ncbi:MAG: hypothetical protein GC179_24895 [Anaerolineaceae bacterium]|nr:hypothetical protein [Anaerolineaceae bacterium]
MIHNVLWLEENLVLVSIQLPIETENLINGIDSMLAKKLPKRNSNAAILVDARELHPPLYETALADFQTVLINLESRGLVVIYGMPSIVEQLLKRTLFSHPVNRYSVYFAANQNEAIGLVHQHRQSINTTKTFKISPSSQKSPQGGKAKFRNSQTEQLYQAFVSDPERYRTWRTLVNGLYEDGEIAFETVMFAKLHQLGDTRDSSIDWDQIIMALLHDTDL